MHGGEEHTVLPQGSAEVRGADRTEHSDPVTLVTSLIGAFEATELGTVIVMTWPKSQGLDGGLGNAQAFSLHAGGNQASDSALGVKERFLELTRGGYWACVVLSECPATNWALRDFIEPLMVIEPEDELSSTCRGIWATSALRPGECLWAHQLIAGAGNPLYLGKLGNASPAAADAGLVKISQALVDCPYDVAASRKRAHDFRDSIETELEVMGCSKELEHAVEALGNIFCGLNKNYGAEALNEIALTSEDLTHLLYLTLDNVLLRDVALNLAVAMPEFLMCVYSDVATATSGLAWANALSICAVAAINIGMSDYAYGLLEEVRRTYREHSLSSLLLSLMEQGREDAIARAVEHAYAFICDQYRVRPRLDVLM